MFVEALREIRRRRRGITSRHQITLAEKLFAETWQMEEPSTYQPP
jgi:hypothetical protein